MKKVIGCLYFMIQKRWAVSENLEDLQSKLPIRSPLFSVTLHQRSVPGPPERFLTQMHLYSARTSQTRSTVSKNCPKSLNFHFKRPCFFFLLRSILFVSESVSRLRCAVTKIMVSGKTITRNWRKFFIFYLVDEWSTACGYRFH